MLVSARGAAAIAAATTTFFVAALVLLGHPVSALRVLGGLLETSRHPNAVIDLFINLKPLELSSHDRESAYFGLQEFAVPASMGSKLKSSLRVNGEGTSSRAAKRQAVYEALREHAMRTQRSTIAHLRSLGYDTHTFWINNSILIKDAPSHLIALLINFSYSAAGTDIISLAPNRIVARVPEPKPVKHGESAGEYYARTPVIPWNLKLIKAHRAWEYTRGEGVVVANIDTGVDYRHPQLRSSYRGYYMKGDGGSGDSTSSVATAATATEQGRSPPTDSPSVVADHEYNWFDPSGQLAEATDVHGHGTHTMGTMVGRTVGVAPGARWIAAQGCDQESCSQERLLASAQWVMCPTDGRGSKPRCDLGADIVNNSWGGAITDEESMTWFSGAVAAWLAADMIPIFAQGNSGPACATAGTPGDLADVIAVGAIDAIGSLTVFSSRGPGGAKLGHARWKPDYVAPGQAVVSCASGGGLIAMSGTSMAAPHVAGVAALLLSLRSSLTFEQMRKLLTRTVNTVSLLEPQMGQQACYGVRWNQFPNYQYGHGLIDVEAAVANLQGERDTEQGRGHTESDQTSSSLPPSLYGK